MAPLLLLTVLLLGWLVHLMLERVRVGRDRRAIPLRIAITGTRGKTTVTRRLAAVLSQDGRKVLAKTTGSNAEYLFPDGSVHEIHRLGAPSIIEQKRLLRQGAKLGVDVVLAEVMSLRPEYHRVEVQQILQPHLVLATNFRVDHIEAQGNTRKEVASVLALDVPRGARALVHEEEWEEEFLVRVAGVGGEVEKVPARSGGPPRELGEFGPNLDLVRAAARSLGVAEEVIQEGLRNAQPDVGALREWAYTCRASCEPWLLVNAFAANDPESTLGIYDHIMEEEGIGPEACVGLLSLRPDRGDRTLQWAQALEAGALTRFRRLYLAGLHGPALKHRLRRHPEKGRIRLLRLTHPDGIMSQLLGRCQGGDGPPVDVGKERPDSPRASRGEQLLFGFGNIAGLGRSLVEYWQKEGEPRGI
jgi:poly-gamma-glutamate synthase PgsB/CapB